MIMRNLGGGERRKGGKEKEKEKEKGKEGGEIHLHLDK